MPKVSEEHKEQRRAQILDAAQHVFARYGFEGSTVSRLEAETGLSRGAIFSYFENKDDLFVAVVSQSSDRLVAIWMERGFRALLDAIAHEDPDWLAVQLEAARRVRTDEAFRARVAQLEQRAADLREERFARVRPGLRDDLPLESVVMFLNLVANAVAFARVVDDRVPDLDVLLELVETGVAPR